MAKVVGKFFTKTKQNFDMGKKFMANTNSGGRIVPTQLSQKDAEYQLRIDAGEVVDGKRNVYLQVNAQAKATALKSWLRKYGSHANLAVGAFDTATPDPEAEAERVLEDLERQARDNV